MEEILINVDSRYRDIITYPSESKFRINLEKTYKNIVSVRMISVEMNNSINYIDSKKNNNWFTIHLPNKENDPEGTRIQLEDGLLQTITAIQNIINITLKYTFNSNKALQELKVDGKNFAEKYFYFLYLNENTTLNFDFNVWTVQPETLKQNLILKEGWHSVYGIIAQIKEYVVKKYNERKDYLKSNPLATPIPLDTGNFTLNQFDLKIFDRRFRSVDTSSVPPVPTPYDCIRIDTFVPSGPYNGFDINSSVALLKQEFYKFFIYDTVTFTPLSNPTIVPTSSMGILDKLTTNNYVIPIGYDYTGGGTKLSSTSKYPCNSVPDIPSPDSSQIYNLSVIVDSVSYRVYFVNSFIPQTINDNTNSYYYWVDPLKVVASKWKVETITPTEPIVTNTLLNLVNKTYLKDNYFITQSQYNNYNFKPTLKKDVPSFDIDFNTLTTVSNTTSGTLDVKRLQYPSVGFYMGFRPTVTKNSYNFLYSSYWDESNAMIKGSKIFDTAGEDYIFMKLNDWGYLDFFNQVIFAKILLTSGLGNPKLDDYINKEYRFRQPVNIQKLDIELIDYLGNTIDMNGFDFSFTLELRQIVNSDHKASFEKQNLIFSSNIY